EQSTVKVNKAEAVTPAGGAAKRGFGVAAAPTAPSSAAPSSAVPAARGFGAVATPQAAPVAADVEVIEAVVPEGDLQEIEVVDGASCPIDPMERLQCESCQ